NDIERFTNTREPGQGDFLWAGNARVWIKAYGTVVIRVQGDCPTRLLHLYDVAYCPDLHCNLVSFRILRQQGLWWDTKSNPTVLRRRNDAAIATLQERYGQWVIEYNDVKQPQATGYFWDFYLKSHSAHSIIRALRTFVTFMKTQFSITVAVIETDNETFRSTEAQRWKDDQGIA
ncbi:hypothetical protein A1F97_11291, partial [Pyrenophora tritici-repentis]